MGSARRSGLDALAALSQAGCVVDWPPCLVVTMARDMTLEVMLGINCRKGASAGLGRGLSALRICRRLVTWRM